MSAMDSPDEFIQGIGNEVFYFFCLVGLIALFIVSWFSTFVAEPNIQSVILVEERSLPRGTVQAAQIREVDVTEFLQGVANARPDENNVEVEEDVVVVNQPEVEDAPPVEASETGEVNENAASDVVNVTASDVVNVVEEEESIPEEGRVTIRLKFLNDTQKDVEASLVEKIGQFKRRNFTEELSNSMRVRLIYNGQVLSQESNTLQSYGLTDKCVVHCLVHQSQQSNNTAGQEQPRVGHHHHQHQHRHQPSDLDLSIYCIPMLGLVLVMLWYFRFTYSAYFNLMSTMALLGLTSLYFLSVYGTHFHVNVAVRTGGGNRLGGQ